MVTWNDELTQPCKTHTEQGGAGNIFNQDQFCPPVQPITSKFHSAHGETNNRKAKMHNNNLPSLSHILRRPGFSHLLGLPSAKLLSRTELSTNHTLFLQPFFLLA